MKLNLGCGSFPLNGFVNIDVYEGDCVDLVCNIINLPYEDNSIDEIYAGHVIEHLTMNEARKGLKEWLRILKKGGTIGIVIPDKDLTPKHMIEGDKVPGKPYRAHHSYWDLKTLKFEVGKAGFEDVETMNIDTYPHLVARPKWQSGIIALKGGKKMKSKKEIEVEPTNQEILEHNKLDETYCKHEKKFVYNPTKKKHCPFCRRLL